ncbi:MAG: hypothetical protein M3Q49_21910 [Actinomycetota bacterium]|nr:hypothetical protein [Actinomycetota bacterium]
MSVERSVYTGVLFVTVLLALLSAVLLLMSPHEGTKSEAWFWGAAFVGSSLAAAWCFWELLGGAA